MALRVIAAALLLPTALLLVSCGGEEQPPTNEAPAGILQELRSGTSITTDVNARAPAFAREDAEGRVIRTQDFIGQKALLLDFWSVFCQSCLQEIPFLLELHDRYGGEGLQIVSVNTDFFPQARIESFMEKTGLSLPFPLVLDRDQSLSRLFQVEALPVTVLIDSSGWIRMVHLGYSPEDRDMIERRARKAVGSIRETVVTLQPVEGKTDFAPPGEGVAILAAGARAPSFAATGIAGKPFSFTPERGGKPAVLFFWSLFCQPCREEFPLLVSLAGKLSSEALDFYAVNVDTGKLRPAAEKFLRKNGAGLVSIFDLLPDESTGEASLSFGVKATPSLFLVDGDGLVVFSSAGEIPPAELEERIGRLAASSSQAGEKR